MRRAVTAAVAAEAVEAVEAVEARRIPVPLAGHMAVRVETFER